MTIGHTTPQDFHNPDWQGTHRRREMSPHLGVVLKLLKTTEVPYERLCTQPLNEPRRIFYKYIVGVGVGGDLGQLLAV